MMVGGAAAQDGGVSLPTIDIFGGNDGYQVTQSQLTRNPAPLINTPQTVNVVPEQVIKDQNATNIQEALRNVSGITFRAGEGGNQGDTPYIRGLEARGDIFRDGIRDPGWYNRDAFAIESIEVYKGPSSFLFGRGSTGGVINIVSKTPLDRDFAETAVTASTAPGARATLDANKKVNDNVSTRLVVMGQRYDVAGRDYIEDNRYGVAPSLKMRVDDKTVLTLSYIYQHEENVPDYGIPFLNGNVINGGVPRRPAPIPRDTFFGILSGNPDRTRVDASIATAKLEHQLNDQVKITNTTRYSDVLRFQRNVFPEPNLNVPTLANLNAPFTTNRGQTHVRNIIGTNQTDLDAKFSTGTWEHHFVAGADAADELRDFLRADYTQNTTADFSNPDPFRFGGTLINPTASRITIGKSNSLGGYVADQIKLNQYFELLGGLRYDYFYIEQNAPLANSAIQNLSHKDNLVSYRVGGVFHPIPNTSIYLMHGTSFNPSAENNSVTIGTNPAAIRNTISTFNLGPEKNETTEFGVKADVLNGRLSLASAIFRTEKSNARVQDPANLSVTVLEGVTLVKGFEASATGKLTDQWQIIASYTYLDTEIVKSRNPGQLGLALPTTAPNSASLWTTYDFTPKFQAGVGVFYVDEMFGDAANTAVVPDYVRVDAMAAYKLDDKSTLQLNIYNLTDKYYFANAASNWVVPGPSRYASLTWRKSW